MENVNGCKYCLNEEPITDYFESDGAGVQYFIRANGDLVGDLDYFDGSCCEVQNHFNYCPFCGRKF